MREVMNAACDRKRFDLFAQLKHLMVVGIDCYHDTSAGKRSIGALVASLNQGMTRWVSSTSGLRGLSFYFGPRRAQ